MFLLFLLSPNQIPIVGEPVLKVVGNLDLDLDLPGVMLLRLDVGVDFALLLFGLIRRAARFLFDGGRQGFAFLPAWNETEVSGTKFVFESPKK